VLVALFAPAAMPTNAPTNAPTIAEKCVDFERCCYDSCTCDKCWRSNDAAACQSSLPPYGHSSTLQGGKKLCPFNPDSEMCDPSSACYFWMAEAGSKTYMCPSAACDNMIISHCTSLGYVHPSEKKVAMPQLTKLDLGCAPLVRLGIAPFSDWVEPYDTPATVSTASPWPAAWTTRAPDGAGSHYHIVYELSSSTDLNTFRTNLAAALGINEYYVKDLTESGTTVSLKVKCSVTSHDLVLGAGLYS